MRLAVKIYACILFLCLSGCGEGEPSKSLRIGGALDGLNNGRKVVLLNNGADPLELRANGTFTFKQPVVFNGQYSVTVDIQPEGQICTVSNGNGVGVVADVSNVSVTCSARSYTVGGTVAGLSNGQQVTLRNNGTDPLIVGADGAFIFNFPIAYNGNYVVTVDTQPTGQICTVNNGNGAGMVANVSNVSVICSARTYTIGGTLAGLASGEQVTLVNNDSDPLTVTANGPFMFSTPVAHNGSYLVKVGTSPTGQTCTVGGASGAGLVADVNSVQVTCSTDTYTVGGTVTGLASGQQVTLLNNGADPLTMFADGRFKFATPLAYQGRYLVTVGTQPIGQTCTVSHGSGSGVVANVDSVAVICSTNAYTVSGTVTGLASDQQVTLLNNGADPLTMLADGRFKFATPLAYQGRYLVTVGTQPIGQTCTVSNGSGSGVVANVDSVAVTCSTATYKVGGTVNGLGEGEQVTLKKNGAETLTVRANGNFIFSTGVAYLGSYGITVDTDPIGKTCVVANGEGSGMTTNVTSVVVTCSVSAYTIGGTVTGLGTGKEVVLRNNGGDPLTLSANGSFTFAVRVLYQRSYAITIDTNPTGQTCVVTDGNGGGVSANVDSVKVLCSVNTYSVGGSVTGLASSAQVTLLYNGARVLTNANGAITFPTAIPYGGNYTITVAEQPSGQYCSVLNGSGTGVTQAISNVQINCARAEILYVANKDDNTVSAFSVDPVSGNLKEFGFYPTGSSPRNGTIDPAGKYLYIPNVGDNNFSVFRIDATNGTLTPVRTAAPGGAVPKPWNIVFHPKNPKIAYALATVNYGDANTFALRTLTVDPATGDLAATGNGINFQSAVEWQALTFDPFGYYAYAAQPSGKPLLALKADAITGDLTKISQLPNDWDSWSSDTISRRYYPYNILFGAGNKFAYAVQDPGSFGIFSVDRSNGAMTQITRWTNQLSGYTPVTSVMNPAGTLIFTGSDGDYYSLSADPATGSLKKISWITPYAGGPYKYGGTSACIIGFNSTGKFAYVEDSGYSNIFVYSVASSGALSKLWVIPARKGPNGLTILPAQ
ncbi:beta-propeller fold lactonase family protein [Ralstonia chuxiongensis]|uniref:beta-propeller fold lactonase family protein n=1 Tax=Ralstonia chuxiongensis TaxID=2957504 RepID=UPI0028F51DC2|nr:beta-propeller fold lactonase family protein [Ralstonia chuxiongensis]CAJ0783523.1 6-phosphogluconolactonase [Ralstonia chuxiongensis]